MNMTPYIAGGSGSRQNEFNINSPGLGEVVATSGTTAYLSALLPCAFVVSGHNSTSGLRGTQTHGVILSMNVDLLDFIGGTAELEPIGLYSSVVVRNAGLKLIRGGRDKKFEIVALNSLSQKGGTEGKEKCDEHWEKKDKETLDGQVGVKQSVSLDISDKKVIPCQDSKEAAKSAFPAQSVAPLGLATKQNVSSSSSQSSLYDSLTTDLSKSTLLKMGYVRVDQPVDSTNQLKCRM